MCSSGIPVLTVLPSKTTSIFLPLAPGGHARFARPADLEIAPGPERVAVVEPEGKLGHQRGHLLAQIEVEPDVLDVELVNGKVEPTAIFEEHCPAGKLDRRASKFEIDVLHGHLAVVENKSAMHVLHGELDHAHRGR